MTTTRLARAIHCVLFLFVLGPLAATGALADDISVLGYWEVGDCYGLDVAGWQAYLGNGSHLEIVDVANPGAPAPLGRIQLPSRVDDVVVADGIAYVANGWWGLAIVDVHDPAAPVLLGSLDVGTKAAAVAVYAGFAYLVDTYEGLFVIDVRDPAAPTQVLLLDPAAFPQDIAIAGGRAFLATWNGIFIYDLANPGAPAQQTFIPEGAYYGYEGITVRDQILYAASGQGGLRVWDVSNPYLPVFRDDQNVGDEALDVDLHGDYAAVSCRHTGLKVINVAKPDHLAIVGELDPPGASYEVLCRGGLAYVAAATEGVQIVSLADPAQPQVVGACPVGGTGVGLQVRGDLAYVAEYNGGLRVLDVSDPTAPTPLGYLAIDADARGIALSGDFACMASARGVRICDVADPAEPRAVSFYGVKAGADDIAVRDHLVCYTTGGSGVEVLDVSDPAAPVPYGRLDLPGGEGLAMGDRYAYYAVTDYEGDLGGLYVLDHTVPGTPAIVGRFETWKAMHPAVDGDLVFFWGRGATNEPGLVVLDASDPAQPREVGFLAMLSWPFSIAAGDGYVYLYQIFPDHLAAIDVADPTAPRIVAEYSRPGWTAHCLQVANGLLYANGVWVLRHAHATGVEGTPAATPAAVRLEQPWPNPFNPAVSIAFAVEREQRVQVGVYALDGRRVAELCDRVVVSGRHTLTWDGADARGRAQASGIYLVTVEAGGTRVSRKVVLNR